MYPHGGELEMVDLLISTATRLPRHLSSPNRGI